MMDTQVNPLALRKSIAESARRTRVELEHRFLERFGDKALQMSAIFDTPDAWMGGLASMRDCAGRVDAR